MNNQPNFWFPSMKVAEITRLLETWGLYVSEDQVQRPTGEVVQAIYVVFLQLVFGITPETLEEPAQRSLAVIEDYPELYSTSINLVLFLHHVQRLATAARVQDFNMRDLVAPESERTRNILSAIINFIQFTEERGGFVKRLRSQSAAAVEERDSARIRVEELRKKVSDLKAQRAEEEERCRILREENVKKTNNIITIKNAQAKVVQNGDALKKQKSALNRQRETINKEIEAVTASINSMKSRIVQSPDRIKKNISHMSSLAQTERVTIAEIDKKSRDLKAKLDALSDFEKSMKELIDDLRAIQVDHVQIEKASHKLSIFRTELGRKLVLRDQLLVRSERAKRQMQSAEGKVLRAQELAEESRSKSEDDIARLKKEYQIMSEERRENERIDDEKMRKADEIQRQMTEHLKKNEAELNELLSAYWAVRHDAEVYMETLADKLGIDLS